MSYIHKHLLRRGKLTDLLPNEADIAEVNRSDIEAARAEIEMHVAEDRNMSREVRSAIRRLNELDRKNHYGESLKRAFGGN